MPTNLVSLYKSDSSDKVRDIEEIIAEAGVSLEETAFVGDDLGDLTLLAKVGLSIAVAAAVSEVMDVVMFKTNAAGGCGALGK